MIIDTKHKVNVNFNKTNINHYHTMFFHLLQNDCNYSYMSLTNLIISSLSSLTYFTSSSSYSSIFGSVFLTQSNCTAKSGLLQCIFSRAASLSMMIYTWLNSSIDFSVMRNKNSILFLSQSMSLIQYSLQHEVSSSLFNSLAFMPITSMVL